MRDTLLFCRHLFVTMPTRLFNFVFNCCVQTTFRLFFLSYKGRSSLPSYCFRCYRNIPDRFADNSSLVSMQWRYSRNRCRGGSFLVRPGSEPIPNVSPLITRVRYASRRPGDPVEWHSPIGSDIGVRIIEKIPKSSPIDLIIDSGNRSNYMIETWENFLWLSNITWATFFEEYRRDYWCF